MMPNDPKNPVAAPAGRASLIPPTNVAAEQVILGAILSSTHPASIELTGAEFVDPVHRAVYRMARYQAANGITPTPRSIVADLAADALEDMGGPAYLAQLVAAVPAVPLSNYVDSVRDAWVRRKLIGIGETMVGLGKAVATEAFGPEGDVVPRDGAAQARDTAERLAGVAHQLAVLLGARTPPGVPCQGGPGTVAVAMLPPELGDLAELHDRRAAAARAVSDQADTAEFFTERARTLRLLAGEARS